MTSFALQSRNPRVYPELIQPPDRLRRTKGESQPREGHKRNQHAVHGRRSAERRSSETDTRPYAGEGERLPLPRRRRSPKPSPFSLRVVHTTRCDIPGRLLPFHPQGTRVRSTGRQRLVAPRERPDQPDSRGGERTPPDPRTPPAPSGPTKPRADPGANSRGTTSGGRFLGKTLALNPRGENFRGPGAGGQLPGAGGRGVGGDVRRLMKKAHRSRWFERHGCEGEFCVRPLLALSQHPQQPHHSE